MTIRADEGQTYTAMSASRAERTLQFHGAAREYDDDFDFPPTAHPGRGLFTVSLCVIVIMTFVGGLRLISLMLTSLT